MGKNYICEFVDECGYTAVECLHSVEHSLVGDSQVGCNGGRCGILERETSCINIRKLKLEKLGRSSLVEVVSNSEVV